MGEFLMHYKMIDHDQKQLMDNIMESGGMIRTGGAWEIPSSDEAWNDATDEYRNTVRTLLSHELEKKNFPELSLEAEPLLSKPITGIIDDVFGQHFDKNGQYSFRSNDCIPENLPYTTLAHIISVNCS